MADLLQELNKIDRGIKAVTSTIRNIPKALDTKQFSMYRDSGIMDFRSLYNTPIEKYCMIEMADMQKLRLLSINKLQKDVTLYKSGDSTSGVTNKVSDEAKLYDYSYVEDNNYLTEYQSNADKTTTKTKFDNNNYQNFHQQGHNTLYGVTQNLYYDDNDSGTDKFGPSKKLEYYEENNNRNSLLKKTKQLFRDRKMSTVISRFHTDNEKLQHNDNFETARSVYGLSHGRNLLTYDAERNGVSYDTNGYNNPYCRVWTHHHQYSDYRSRMMRPFVMGDAENSEVVDNKEFHKWDGFDDMKMEETYNKYNPNKFELTNENILAISNNNINGLKMGGYDNVTKDMPWGWKSSGADGWEHSVLNRKNGLVNITPKYLGGAGMNVHTKDCMFSIENLAWQGFDPYSFETALSWEQRGPFGGRIMWFPPYGLTFNEESSVNWNEHSFIGRGENVFTYANTSRSGTLSFMMVVDHPSILDYATWHEPTDLKDTDIFRFFAGCDFCGGKGDNSGVGGGSSSILKSFVKPTPLTDEYLKPDDGIPPIPVTDENKPESETPTEPDAPTPEEEIILSFVVFYPNNYTGYYDRKDNQVDPISYLLFGKGAQWNCVDDDVSKAEVLPINFDNVENAGSGYEMSNSKTKITQQNNDKNYIIGTSSYETNGKKINQYVQDINKKWYYRIDGEYVGHIKYKEIDNTFGQTITKSGMQNTKDFQLNCDITSVNNAFNMSNPNYKYYTIAEIAYALARINGKNNAAEKIQQNSKKDDNGSYLRENSISELLTYFDKKSEYRVTKCISYGMANSQGRNSDNATNEARNKHLSKERSETVIEWFNKLYGEKVSLIDGDDNNNPFEVIQISNNDENSFDAKCYRCAIFSLCVKRSETKSVEQMNVPQDNAEQGYVSFKGWQEVRYYQDTTIMLYKPTAQNTSVNEKGKDKLWYYDEDSKMMKVFNVSTLRNKCEKGYSRWLSDYHKNDNTKQDKNSLRYDQEYHFFKQLEAKHPDVFSSVVKKLQYFDPAFHSMTPEGFMGRLTFLHQCTRQGETITASDRNGFMANNLAFGRPPFCILRLGDFYYQKIVIRNISINYDPLVLDLNNEGVGVVPLIANVSITFNFIGGGDLTGPVRRLQTALSHNYFANTRLYDNRADRVKYKETNNWDTMKKGNIDFESSYFHHTKMSDNK